MTRSIQFFIFIFMILIFLSKGFTSQSLDGTQEPSPKLQSIKPSPLPSEEPDLEFSPFLHMPEILTHIVGRVETRDLLSLSAVSRPLHRSIEEIFEIFAKKDFCLGEKDKITTWQHTYNLYSVFWQCQNWPEALKVFSSLSIYLAPLLQNFDTFIGKLIPFQSLLLRNENSKEFENIDLVTAELFDSFQPFLRQTDGLTARLIRGDVKLAMNIVDFFKEKIKTTSYDDSTKEEALKDILLVHAKTIFLESLISVDNIFKYLGLSNLYFEENFKGIDEELLRELRQNLLNSHKSFMTTHGSIFILCYIFKNQFMFGLPCTDALELYYEAQKNYKKKYGTVHPRSFTYYISLDHFLESEKPVWPHLWPNLFIELPTAYSEAEISKIKKNVSLLEELGDSQITEDLSNALNR
jgi:hypothetical protein